MLGAASGALDIAHNDDWDYRWVALGLYRSHQIEPTTAIASLIGQVLAVQPLLWLSGGAPWAFFAMTAGFAVAGVAAVYGLVRRLVGTGSTVLALLVLILFPGFLVNTTSFMTDVPALAATYLCLALGAVAIGSHGPRRWRWLALSLIAGCFAISIRQFALAAPLAVVIAMAAADGRHRRRYAAAGLAVFAAFGVIHLATAGLPGQVSAILDTAQGVRRVQLAFSTLAFVLLPAIVLAVGAWHRRWRWRDLVPGLFVGLAIAADSLSSLLSTGKLPGMFIGNIFTQVGTSGPGALAGSRDAIYPDSAWDVIKIVALAATIALPAVASGIIGAVIRSGGLGRTRLRAWLGSPAGMLAVFVAFTAAGLAAFGYAFAMFDRYLWPLAPAVAALLLVRPSRPDQEFAEGAEEWDPAQPRGHEEEASWVVGAAGASAILLLANAALSFLLLLNSNAFSVARWQMGLEATRLGFPAATVDAGMEWVDYNSVGIAGPAAKNPVGAMWYEGMWPSFQLCALVSSTPRQGPVYQLLIANAAAYRQFQSFGPELPLYLYRVANPACQSAACQ